MASEGKASSRRRLREEPATRSTSVECSWSSEPCAARRRPRPRLRGESISMIVAGGHGSIGVAPGTRFGPYEVLGPLGAGGMGEVYRARDPRLGREVAIKVLPTRSSSDPERVRRFEVEARA